MTVNVFTAERYKGNRLAIVAVRGNALSQAKKQLIAKEFGFSETVFLHDAPGPGLPRRLDIFTEQEEIPFAGHPIIGTAGYLFTAVEQQRYTGPQDRENRQSTVLLTKAGPVTVISNPYRQVHACIVPHDIHIHQSTITLDDILATQPQVQLVPTIETLRGKTFPVVSIVKGMAFSLVDLTEAPEVMTALKVGESPAAGLDEEWNVGFLGCLYYQRLGVEETEGRPAIHKIQQRMIFQGREDPGTGSASCALGCYLSLTMTDKKVGHRGTRSKEKDASQTDTKIAAGTKSLNLGAKKEHNVFGIEQGVEMGRKCQICVEVDITEKEEGQRAVSRVMLSGRSVTVTRGELVGVY